jgi:large subunit GTPase 1
MVTCGVLPIDTIKEYLSPIQMIMDRVDRDILQNHYRIKLPERNSKYYTATAFLQIYATKRGLLTGRALPNEA